MDRVSANCAKAKTIKRTGREKRPRTSGSLSCLVGYPVDKDAAGLETWTLPSGDGDLQEAGPGSLSLLVVGNASLVRRVLHRVPGAEVLQDGDAETCLWVPTLSWPHLAKVLGLVLESGPENA